MAHSALEKGMVSHTLFQRRFLSSRASVWHLLMVAALALLLRPDTQAAEIYANEPSPYNAAKGAAFGYPDAVQFLVPGWAPTTSWRWTGTLPPGLSLGGRTTAGDFNTNSWPEIIGTPTTPGTYNITLRASQGLDQAGPFTPVINYQIYVSPDYYPPLFKNMPASQTTTAGSSITLSAPAYFGKTYQWKFNGVDIPGATSDSYSFTASAASAGFYSTMSWGDGGSALSTEASVTVITVPPASATLATGAKLTLTVGVANAGGSSFQWSRNSTAIAGATSSTYVVPAVTVADAGSYTVSVSNYGQVATSAAALVTVDGTGPVAPPPASDARLSNMSVRTNLASGQTMIVGFVTSGAKNIMVRAVGPGLATSFPSSFTTAQVLPDPRLRVFSGSTVVATNEDWDASLAAGFARLGAFPLTSGSRDSALLQSIEGAQTLHVTGTGSGIVLFEGYDADTTGTNRLKNLAARNRVGTGGDILIAGFVIAGTGNETLLIRGVGPTLFDSFAISDRLLDPKLEIYDSTGTKVAENDNWSASLASVFTQVGAVALTAGSKDAALQITLPPGAYTAQVSGINGGTGEALVEVYEIK
jgi:hypothetical protein